MIHEARKNGLNFDPNLIYPARFKQIMDSPDQLMDQANDLLNKAGVPINPKAYGLESLQQIQNYYDRVGFYVLFDLSLK